MKECIYIQVGQCVTQAGRSFCSHQAAREINQDEDRAAAENFSLSPHFYVHWPCFSFLGMKDYQNPLRARVALINNEPRVRCCVFKYKFFQAVSIHILI